MHTLISIILNIELNWHLSKYLLHYPSIIFYFIQLSFHFTCYLLKLKIIYRVIPSDSTIYTANLLSSNISTLSNILLCEVVVSVICFIMVNVISPANWTLQITRIPYVCDCTFAFTVSDFKQP